MMIIHTFCVAGWCFDVQLPATVDIYRVLPSFVPFCTEVAHSGSRLFRFELLRQACETEEEGDVLEESRNDLGHVVVKRAAGGYRIELCQQQEAGVHVMLADASFTQVCASLRWDDPGVGHALGSLLRIAFSQAVLLHQGVALHAAAVERGGRAYLFMGRSGTGKSTHAAGWQRCFADCSLLNDDNPVIRIRGNEVWVYGSPWSGKTPCYKNQGYPVAGIVRLVQAPLNRFERVADVAGFVTLLPGCFAVRADERLYGALCDTLVEVCSRIKVGTLHCLPDDEAVAVCFAQLSKEERNR